MNMEIIIKRDQVARLARFFVEASSSTDIDLTDEIALDRAYDEALYQIGNLARKGESRSELTAVEALVRELADLLSAASGEKVEHARRIDRALSGTDFVYVGGKIGRRQYSGFANLFPMNGAAR